MVRSFVHEIHTVDNWTVERREVPTDVLRAVSELSTEISLALSDLADIRRLVDLIDTRVTELPAGTRTLLRPPQTSAGAAVLGTLPVDDVELGQTPPDWQTAARPDCSRPASLCLDIALLLLARSIGIPFAWANQQNGQLVNNVVPTIGHENEQLGSGSLTLLSPHTEDAFHPRRANLLLLGCLRNPDGVGTTISSVRHIRLTAGQRRELLTPNVPILPDISYGTGHLGNPGPAVPTLWQPSEPEGLTLRYEPTCTPLDSAGAEFRAAYRELGAELERVCNTVILSPGEILLLDNDVAAHGRVPFRPRYDGGDRWLKRINIRLPHRRRNPAEADESGYGQQIVAPFRGIEDCPSIGG
ncbi:MULTISPECIES: TauD/TfdA family dioxygenase [unclassified Nocardia]|uniref:TauD/TfdA family dioxygenase n=1 Tax=unclassified Nocardia TaxID=2637762 RepID=UPI001CE3E574|nr:MULTISPECIES: TauD/TfdA family dioxygenase [unclassified Nocardia]